MSNAYLQDLAWFQRGYQAAGASPSSVEHDGGNVSAERVASINQDIGGWDVSSVTSHGRYVLAMRVSL